ncbi:MAG TPA: ABC transporter substrate-binding protein [Oscillospiraceae bacterium]|nr:ABC transporter substrate-binding protein [Oscillospiraceae bacterium]
MKKLRLTALVLALVLIAAFIPGCGKTETTASPSPSPTASESPSPTPDTRETIKLGLLKGPTGVGAAKLLSDNDMNETANIYDVTLAAEPTELVSAIVAGTVDIAAVPTNLAASLFNKTDRGVQLLALNTLGVLYILENGDTVHSISDLAGKTLYATGQASNPEYILDYILRAAGLEPGVDVDIEYKESAELVTLMAAGEVSLAMLPVPAATTVLMKNSDVRSAIDLTEAWNDVVEDGTLTMGCVIVRKDFADEHHDLVNSFLDEYGASIDYVENNVDEAAAMVAQYGITASEEIAKAAIPDCNLTFVTGTDMRDQLQEYYMALYQADPASVGGSIPDDAFYYVP